MKNSTSSEINDEHDEDTLYSIDAETQKQKIKRIIEYQKSLLSSSSSSSSPFSNNICASSSSFSCSSKSRRSLLQLMKGGNTSLRRLFDMEHTSLSNHFNDYSGSPTIKPILLWDSDTGENGFYTSASWRSIQPLKQLIINSSDCGSDRLSGFASEGSFLVGESDIILERRRKNTRKQKGRRLIRTKSFKRLPGFGLWRFKGFRLRLRLKWLKIMICGRKFCIKH